MKKFVALFALALAAGTAASAQTSSTLANLSSRGLVGQTSGSLIAGFVIAGPVPKAVLVRGSGPGLAVFGISNPSAAVGINIYDGSGNLIASNRGFQNDPSAAAFAQTAANVGAFPLSDPGDSELVATLPPGGYSVEIAANAADAPDGVALLEVYDADAPGSPSRIANLSSRGQVGATAGTLIAGFVVSGNAPKSMLIRGVGPDLAQFGVANSAADVDINVYDSSGNLVASNTGYQTDPNAAVVAQTAATVGAFALSNPGDSAVVVTLPPGAYTVQVAPTAPDAADGVGLVEVYDADSATLAPSSTGS